MKYLKHSGEYILLLKELLESVLGSTSDKEDKAEVLFPSQIESADPSHPQVIIEGLDFTNAHNAADGRKTYHLSVDVFIRVPSNLGVPEVISTTMAGYALAELTGQRFGFSTETIGNPTALSASPTPWSNDEAGHQVSFSQIIHVGEVADDPFQLIEGNINRRARTGELENVRHTELSKED